MDLVPVLAPLASLMCFVAPLSTIREVDAKQSTGDLPALTFVSMSVMCAIWCTYGVLRDDWTVISPNAVGSLLAAYYLKVFDAHSPKSGARATELRRSYAVGIGLLVVLLAVVVLDDPARAVQVVGTCGALLSMVFAASPLFALPAVFKTKTPDSIPLGTAVMLFTSNVLWFVYGYVMADDSSIWIPNSFGAAVSAVQLVVHAVFALNLVQRGGVRVASL